MSSSNTRLFPNGITLLIMASALLCALTSQHEDVFETLK